jgi:hypothetical protein
MITSISSYYQDFSTYITTKDFAITGFLKGKKEKVLPN